MAFTTLVAALALAPVQGAVEVPFRIGDDAIIADVLVNGKKASLMVDTGFGGAVSIDDVINIGAPTGTMNLQDFVGVFQAKSVKIKSLQIGAHKVDPSDMEAMLAPGERYTTLSYNTHVDGLLGLQPFKKTPFEINFEKKKFVFHPKSYDITTRVPDNKRTFMVKMLPIGHSSIELEAVASNGKKIYLALDTGNAFYATTHRDVLERVGLWPQGQSPKFTRKVSVASGPVDSWTKRMTNMTIFGVPVAESYWDIIDLPASSAEGDGTVGFGFLKNFNITVDYERRRVWLENFSGKVANDLMGDVGIVIREDTRARRLRVVSVSPEGPADKAGIKAGDHVLSLNGKELSNHLGVRQLHRLTEGPVGTKLTMAVSRNGQLIRVELERTNLSND